MSYDYYSLVKTFMITVETSGDDPEVDCITSFSVHEYLGEGIVNNSDGCNLQVCATTHYCTICTQGTITDKSVTLEPCGHKFCAQCIQQWKNKRGKCPLCRTPFHSRLSYSTRSTAYNFDRAWALVRRYIERRLAETQTALLVTYDAVNCAGFVRVALRRAKLPLPSWHWVCLRALAWRLRFSGDFDVLARRAKVSYDSNTITALAKIYGFLESRIAQLSCGADTAIRSHSFTLSSAPPQYSSIRKPLFAQLQSRFVKTRPPFHWF